MSRVIILLAGLLFSISLVAQKGEVIVEVSGIDTKTGGLLNVAVFDEANFPPNDKETAGKIVKANGSSVTVSFEHISTGTYAIAVFQDENSNGELDTKMFGIPKEPYGFSNNKFGKTGPPKFADVSFSVEDGKATRLKINLK